MGASAKLLAQWGARERVGRDSAKAGRSLPLFTTPAPAPVGLRRPL